MTWSIEMSDHAWREIPRVVRKLGSDKREVYVVKQKVHPFTQSVINWVISGHQ